MKKQYYFLSTLLIASLLLSGCGKNNDNTPSAPAESAANISQKNNNFQSTDNPNEIEPSKNEDDSISSEEQPVETPTPKSATVSRKKAYSDMERTVSILGLQEYGKIKTDKYTDKASKGKKYLVLFLEVYNKGKEKDYFNVNYLSAKVDGAKIENTFLFNEPEGYPTIFANIASGDAAKGFIVWEVSKNWKQLDVTYEGWKDIDGLTLDAKLTKKDLKTPQQYSKGS